jgi:PPOX class probable F420-dependent enzyme
LNVDPKILTALLTSWPVGHLATVTPEGRPHQVPVVFVGGSGVVHMPVDAKRKRAGTLARVRNVAANGWASLLLDAYENDWQQLWWVRLDGAARIVTAEPTLLEQTAERLRLKYPQYGAVEPYGAEPTLLELRWSAVSAWSQAGDLAPIRRAAGLPAQPGQLP